MKGKKWKKVIQIRFCLLISLFSLIGFSRKPTKLSLAYIRFQPNYNQSKLVQNQTSKMGLVRSVWSVNLTVPYFDYFNLFQQINQPCQFFHSLPKKILRYFSIKTLIILVRDLVVYKSVIRVHLIIFYFFVILCIVNLCSVCHPWFFVFWGFSCKNLWVIFFFSHYNYVVLSLYSTFRSYR